MRVTRSLEPGQSWGLFAGDIPNGVMLECESCGHETPSVDTGPVFCKCGLELMYATWWEW